MAHRTSPRAQLSVEGLIQLAFGDADGAPGEGDRINELLRLIDTERDGGERAPAFWAGEKLDALDASDRRLARALSVLFWEIDAIGGTRNPAGGRRYDRFAWTDEDAWLRTWFAARARRMNLEVSVDHAGNQWAWTDGARRRKEPALVIGSHLDSVPAGGPFDGVLGVISALVALGDLRARGWEPPCPIAIVNLHDREGTRFSVASTGSRVLTGALEARRALALKDAHGATMRSVMAGFSHRVDAVRSHASNSRALGDFSAIEVDAACQAAAAPAQLAADPEMIETVGAFLELHIEQGATLRSVGAPVAVAGGIWPHGRWRLDITGAANHTGATQLDARADALEAFARIECALLEEARAHGARAAVGRVEVEPNGMNVIAAHVRCWIDCRAASADAIKGTIGAVEAYLERAFAAPVRERDAAPHVQATLACEAYADATIFSERLRTHLVDAAAGELEGGGVPVLSSAAGHDAGVLERAGVPAGMLFVRNDSGVTHAPREHARLGDCVAGVHALERAITSVAIALAAGRL